MFASVKCSVYASGCLSPFFRSQANATAINLPTSTLEIQRFPREPQRSTGAERPDRGAGNEPITAAVIPQISGVQTCSTVRVLEWKDGVATLPGSNLRVSVALGHRFGPLCLSPQLLVLVNPPACARQGAPGCAVVPLHLSWRVPQVLQLSSCPIPMALPFWELSTELTEMSGGLQQLCPAQGGMGCYVLCRTLSASNCAEDLALLKLLPSPWEQWPFVYLASSAS